MALGQQKKEIKFQFELQPKLRLRLSGAELK